MTTISHRNQEILQMRREGMSQTEVARRFNLSPSRVYLIEKQDAATRAMEGRRARMIKQLQDANDMDKLWPVEDLLDALGLIVVRACPKGGWCPNTLFLTAFTQLCSPIPTGRQQNRRL